jgi:light-regulated signal transduction histidine kinase (bacteriophytochrome)
MISSLREILDRYSNALKDHIDITNESTLQAAYTIGRDAIAAGIGVLEIAEIHKEVIVALLSLEQSGSEYKVTQIMDDASDFFVECLGPFEMVQQGYKESYEAARNYNEKLVLINKKLKESIIKQKASDKALLEKNKELKQAYEEMESFSYSVSHDLRAPLRSIDGFSKALLEDCMDKLDSKSKHYLKRVCASCQLMENLIDDILKLSRISRSKLQYEEVDLSSMAREIAAKLQSSEPKRCAKFIITDKIMVTGDERLLRVAMNNLLGNAWKYTKTHTRARIEVGMTELDGSLVYFVRDDGVGFDMAYINKLFNPFQRLHSTTEFSGTGIGLATVRRIIHRHGGIIWAEGNVEKGATFYFTLNSQSETT